MPMAKAEREDLTPQSCRQSRAKLRWLELGLRSGAATPLSNGEGGSGDSSCGGVDGGSSDEGGVDGDGES